MHEFPVIKLEIQDMKYQVLHALHQHHSETETHVNEALERSLKNFDYERVVEDAVKSQLEKAITSAVSHTITQIFWDETVRDAMYEAVKKILLLGVVKGETKAKKNLKDYWREIFREKKRY